MTGSASISLELDDIQSGALHERPSPYVGTYLLLRIDDRAAGRELVRRLLPVVDSAPPSADPPHDAQASAARMTIDAGWNRRARRDRREKYFLGVLCVLGGKTTPLLTGL